MPKWFWSRLNHGSFLWLLISLQWHNFFSNFFPQSPSLRPIQHALWKSHFSLSIELRYKRSKNRDDYIGVFSKTPLCAASMVGDIGGLDRFSGEKLEKLNDMFKRSYMRQTNCNDIKASILTQKRREIAFRAESLRKQILQASREPKQGCQVEFAKGNF